MIKYSAGDATSPQPIMWQLKEARDLEAQTARDLFLLTAIAYICVAVFQTAEVSCGMASYVFLVPF